MNRTFVTFISALALALPIALGQAADSSVEQQLKAHYPTTSVGANGVVVRAGTVVVVQIDGINALPAPSEWPCNSFKSGGHITQTTLCSVNYSPSKDQTRLLQVGEKGYLTAVLYKSSDVVFKVQTVSDDPNAPPFRAAVSFQLPKKAYTPFSAIQELIDQVFGMDPSSPKQKDVELALPATYVNAQKPADQLQLNTDNSFSLQEAGQTYRGSFKVLGDKLELHIVDTNIDTAMTIQGSGLADLNGQTWTVQIKSAPNTPGANVLRNSDIVTLVTVGIDDATIIAKIGSSQCEFETSTDALVQLKRSGVSAAVLKAMVASGK
jgi:hypothetical protein